MDQKLNRISQILAVLVLIATVTGVSSCDKYSYVPLGLNPTDTVHFNTDIQPIFNANCTTCHGGAISPDLRDSYDALTDGGYVTRPGESSRLYTKMISASHSSRSTTIEKSKVLNWINQGALDN
jgi:hypothetical protein